MRKLRALIAGLAAIAIALAVALTVPEVAKAASYNEWQTNGLCMGVQGGNMTPGTAIITWACDDSLNQFWGLDTNSGAPNYFLLRNEADPSECLSVFQKSANIGAPLVIWPCKAVSDNQDQRWSLATAPSTVIHNFNSGLQIVSSNTQGSAVVQWDIRIPYFWMPMDFVIG